MKEVVTHEETHRQSRQLKSTKQSYVSDKTEDEPINEEEALERRKKYLSQYQEIPAFARAVAENLEESGYTEDALNHLNVVPDELDLDVLVPLDISRESKHAIVFYKVIGGDVWNRFLKEIYDWFHVPYVGGKTEYRAWLRSHRPDDP